ncbi:hypothetical protein CC80DRAFT_504610 [Byssothecium circinans]|uniref:Nephrocystin 3-like N-terminal domain-containing protein n=1 Tax=Byssothecium circinans TaxID=147558 RepID=A0A6A5TVY7_9PLEO|nr:hypothetical protein CC80DRAFT_504610 [Byssothecium circinans]
MDPFSVTAGVAGLLSLAIQLATVSAKYGNNCVKGQSYDFIFELNTLVDVLRRLQQFLDFPDTSTIFNQVSVLTSTNTRCATMLRDFLNKLQKTVKESNRAKRAIDKLLWPMTEKEHIQAMEEIHRYTQTFNFALTIAGCSLLSKSSSEVIATLQQQALKLNETKQLCATIPDLVSQIEASLTQISDLQAFVQSIAVQTTALPSISRDLADLKSLAHDQKCRQHVQDRKEIFSWLSSVSFEARQRQIFDRHQSGTGTWLLEHEAFKRWKEVKGKVLWCTGIPGAGKTFMSSLVIDTLRKPTTADNGAPVAFVYADFKDHRQLTTLNLISSITRQLAEQNEAIMDKVSKKFEENTARSSTDKPAPPSLDELMHILQDAQTYLDGAYVIIDAIDELQSLETEGIGDVRFELLNMLSSLKKVSLFCTTRPHIDASTYFADYEQISIEATNTDLCTYLDARIASSRRLVGFVSKDRHLKNHIVSSITGKCSGMFLLARLQIEQVMTAISVRCLRSMLDTLSSRLFDMYEETMRRIRKQNNAEALLAIRAISWVATVKRPLTCSELVHALSVESNDQHLDVDSLVDIQIILEASGGLIQLLPQSLDFEISPRRYRSEVPKEETVGFVHYTLHECFESLPSTTDVNCDIVDTSLIYLGLEIFHRKSHQTETQILSQYPFVGYAALFWPAHAELAGARLRNDLIKLLVSPTRPWLEYTWLRFAFWESFGETYVKKPSGFTVVVVAMHGAKRILKDMLARGVNGNVRLHQTKTPFGMSLAYRMPTCSQVFSYSWLIQSAESNLWIFSRGYNEMFVLRWFMKFLLQNLRTMTEVVHTTIESSPPDFLHTETIDGKTWFAGLNSIRGRGIDLTFGFIFSYRPPGDRLK